MKKHIILILTVFAFSLGKAQTIYVDNQLTADCTGNYSIANRDCSGSDGDAYKTIQRAANAATAGTQVLIRGGVYSEQLSPKNSGTENNYITFKSYNGELAEITGEALNPGIWIEQKKYIIIEGLKIHDVRRWLNVLGSSHIIIRDNEFQRALDPGESSKTGLFLQACDHVKILHNIINESTQDNIGMVDCDSNLIEGNKITKAKHTLWALKCSNYNIIRGNYFHNEIQKIGEIFDCDNVGYGDGSFQKITSVDDTKRNVIEENIFAYTASSGDHSPYSGIQFAGQNCIIRRNIFYECIGPPISLTLYEGEAEYNYSNRISHNVFFDNEFGGIDISGNESYDFSDQQIKNNIFYKNKFIQHDFRWSWYAELNNKPVQVYTGRKKDVLIENNNIFSSEVDELYVIAYGSRFSSSNDSPQSLSWWETNYPQVYKNNQQANPEFVDQTNKDFHLKEKSPMIDAGTFLSQTTNSGNNSTSVKVDDAGWFIDGFGIVSGDTIQVEGQTDYAVIQSVDYITKTLTLDRAISWETGKGVSLRYNGSKPDIGAFEYPSQSSEVKKIARYEGKVIICPNPTNGILRINSDGNDSIEKVFVYNSLGQQVKVSHNEEINISGFESGHYLVKVSFSNGEIIMEKVEKY